MDLSLKDKVVLITGGSKGIGLACARVFLEEGANVAIASRQKDHLERGAADLSNVGSVELFQADLSLKKDAYSLAERVEKSLGDIDILVNSAGAAKMHQPEDLDSEAWHEGMKAKYFTGVHAMDAVLPRMKSRERGAIVNIIGTGGKVPTPTHVAGGAANAGLMVATVGLASAYGKHNIRINGINPGATETERLKLVLSAQAKNRKITVDQVRADISKNIPLGRVADPIDVANLTVFLSSARAAYITGVIVAMDGGANPLI